ncbi:MAE_28990/MAE_18760 family HEPN-like nuclease [Cellvibrio sp. PSBB023]|uniref:MAE_28990/MAE_18760 family HEPN-like nuclease n=1 Tax=Cellvibrio sp. PSBB023 TaxID=1945512 RepID=UPI00098FE9B5|nr:MAE_28990/MAE_18760 family HEPN-like nuclease [Cellvibrio sp. PSBB023]AQT61454.1 hypothetical protein B0D95_16070 [Cellvibrio sp. PSBB023]
MKVRSLDELENIISREYSWRRKELTNIKNLTLSSRSHIKTTLLKSSLTLLYSHWEGFVKKASIAYCEYLNFQGLCYQDLTQNFHVCALINEFQGQYPPRNFKSSFGIVTGKSLRLSEKLKIDSERYIDTQSNLNSEVLKELTQKLGISYSAYELKENLIDERFLGLRNAISHGEYRCIEEEDFIDLYEEITSLIETFKNQISNSAILKEYLADNKPAV